MNFEQSSNYQRMARAIDFLVNHYPYAPDLEKIATEMNLSAYHFQRLFSRWVGVSPKQFMQSLRIEQAKEMLIDQQKSLLDVAMEVGLSGTSRLHDLFVRIEAMTPGQYKQGGKNLVMRYSFFDHLFGEIIIASTNLGICHVSFANDRLSAVRILQQQFPCATLQEQQEPRHQEVIKALLPRKNPSGHIHLSLKGTPFQIKVWQAVLKIPHGSLVTYGQIATAIHRSGAARAVGNALKANPIAMLIPCHRVIPLHGSWGGYRWGEKRKKAMIAWEAARAYSMNIEPNTL